MLTKKQNLLETIHGGNPDRFVNQYEFLHIAMSDPFAMTDPYPAPGQSNIKNGWGVTLSWPEGVPGAFPVHTPETIVCKDITKWKESVKAPNLIFPDAMWEEAQKDVESVDRSQEFVAPFIAPGVFDQCHYLMSIQEALMAFYTDPEPLKDMIKYITEWELQYAETLCDKLHPDALFHHDDWGSQNSTFISPAMFEEFFLDSYKQIYGYYKSHGVELVVHHSDSYAATLVPYMIDMGIDIWQGVMTSNNIPELIEKYGGQISFMGGIDSAKVDFPGWNEQVVAEEVEKACRACGTKYFIPCASQGLPMSTFDGVYESLCTEIDKMSKKMF
ncbi:MAG: uroporphyrinogen decarboxylase family protein [Lachnospiraceae bacterium]|nr:uroporphyrinogen decarboxylase family protein [Lachnospiraceae bacterium]MDD3616751.1 uroporphyrinogen decarboxylase family protein [Lachnospiraceae bacterium]